jgi:hypothetical protein
MSMVYPSHAPSLPLLPPVAGILVDLGHPQSRSSKSILDWGTMSVPTFQTFLGTASEGVIENQCCQVQPTRVEM